MSPDTVAIINQPGAITSMQIELPYQADTLALYQRLCQHHPHNLLLDSAEIQSRQHLKSLLLVDAALQLRCQGQQVSITALTGNGAQVLPWLAEQLQSSATHVALSSHTLQCTYASIDDQLDEDSRLRQPSNVEPLRLLQQRLQQTQPHPLGVFLGGIFAYDYVASFEALPEVPEGDNSCPDYLFYLAETLVVIDHQKRSTTLLANLFSGPDSADYYPQIADKVGRIAAQCQLPRALPQRPGKLNSAAATIQAQPDADSFAATVTQLQQHILAGDIFQVVPSRRFTLPCTDALAAYAQLKAANPSPYMFFLRTNEFEVFGASPESALKYTASTNQVELYPIAGTRPRGRYPDGRINPDRDSRLELELRLDQKELAEHMMLVDLARNDLARIAKPGSRYVANLLQVDRYSHVMHLVSRVVAQLADDLDALSAYRACMNMGTLVGAPKVRAAELIRQVEQQRRGSYGGAVGYLSGNGDMDTCIVIRSAFVRGGQAIVQAGAGVVFDSVPAAEVAETESKARAVIQAIQEAAL
jgi:anthranilate synthase component 1